MMALLRLDIGRLSFDLEDGHMLFSFSRSDERQESVPFGTAIRGSAPVKSEVRAFFL